MSLYRKHRPEKFSDLIGQEHVAETLQQAIANNKIGHSYLFSGSRGIGKTTVARILARSANCEAKEGQPCGKCKSCTTIASGQSVDILEIDAASNRGIDEIRELRDKVRFAPSHGKYKVYIIDEVHMLTKEAFNALLKTLEEPPPHAVFVLATTEAHKIPATIISRCQRFDFRRASLKDVLKLLEKVSNAEKINAERAALALIARAADGAYRDALTLLEQMASESSGKLSVDTVREKLGLVSEPMQWQLISQIIASDKKAALTTYQKFNTQGIDWKYLIVGLLNKLRQLLFYSIAPQVIASDITEEEARQLKKLSLGATEEQVVELINLVMRAETELKQTSMPELPLGAAIVEYMGGSQKAKSKNQNDGVATPQISKLQDNNDSKLMAQNSKLKTQDLEDRRTEDGGQGTEDGRRRTENKNKEDDNHDGIEPLDNNMWQEVVSNIQKKNSALARLLKQSHPFQQNGMLLIQVPYPFWEEKINTPNNTSMILEAMKGVVMGLKKVCAKSNGKLKKMVAESHKKESEKVKSDIEEVFGGS